MGVYNAARSLSSRDIAWLAFSVWNMKILLILKLVLFKLNYLILVYKKWVSFLTSVVKQDREIRNNKKKYLTLEFKFLTFFSGIGVKG